MISGIMCGKQIYRDKKAAKKSAKHLSRVKYGEWGSKYSAYHCKQCNGWHLYTENRRKILHTKQHARGGRR